MNYLEDDQTGPCQICGCTNYPLSYGGPSICPTCDCGYDNTKTQKEEIERLSQELQAINSEQYIKIELENLRAKEVHDKESGCWDCKYCRPCGQCHGYFSFYRCVLRNEDYTSKCEQFELK
jgi:uncharacterized Zn finger protein (UPF0148 family)